MTALLLGAILAAGPARAADESEFWPELNAYVQLNPQVRLHFIAAYARGKDSYNQTLDMHGYVDLSLKPLVRRTLRQEDWLRNKYLWARVGYVRVAKAEGGVPSPAEDRAIVSLYSRVYPPGEVVIELRERSELRWIDGEYSQRHRLRGEVNREFGILDRPVVPYLNAEWFYDTRFDDWSRILVQVGAEITFSKAFRTELYLARQQDELPSESSLDAFGIVLRWFY